MAHGGLRPNGGRPKGSKSKRNKAMEQAVALKEAQDELGDGQTPLQYMLSVMRDPASEPQLALDAAKGAAPYCHKKKPQDVNVSGVNTPVSITMNVVGPKRP